MKTVIVVTEHTGDKSGKRS